MEKSNQLFIEKLKSMPLHGMELSPYTIRYVHHIIQNADYFVSLYEEIFNKVAYHFKNQTSSISLVDFGAGSGILTCYLYSRGISKIHYLDIYETSYNDAQKIGEYFGTKMRYICGDVNTLKTIKIDCLVSMDVIEHIYSLEIFFDTLYNINPNIYQVHLTGANPYNPMVNYKLKKIQFRNENLGRKQEKGDKLRDSFKAYKEIRKEWILKNFPNLSELELNELTIHTRGMTFEDMNDKINEYLQTGIIPPEIKHKTNTCDPTNGNWSERLISKKELDSIIGFNMWNSYYYSVGYNANNGNWWKRLLIKIINKIGGIRPFSYYTLPLLLICIKRPRI
jgi:hypothetical protein